MVKLQLGANYRRNWIQLFFASALHRSAHTKDRIYFLRKIEHRKVHVLQLHCRDVFFFGALPHRAELRWVFQLIISCGCTCHVAEIRRSTRLSGTTFEMQRSIEELLCFSLPWCSLVPTNSHFGPWILRFQQLSRQKLPGCTVECELLGFQGGDSCEDWIGSACPLTEKTRRLSLCWKSWNRTPHNATNPNWAEGKQCRRATNVLFRAKSGQLQLHSKDIKDKQRCFLVTSAARCCFCVCSWSKVQRETPCSTTSTCMRLNDPGRERDEITCSEMRRIQLFQKILGYILGYIRIYLDHRVTLWHTSDMWTRSQISVTSVMVLLSRGHLMATAETLPTKWYNMMLIQWNGHIPDIPSRLLKRFTNALDRSHGSGAATCEIRDAKFLGRN